MFCFLLAGNVTSMTNLNIGMRLVKYLILFGILQSIQSSEISQQPAGLEKT